MKLDLGCGDKKLKDFIGIDVGDFKYPEGEFIRGNVFEILPTFKDNSVEYIASNQFVEHIPKDKFISFMNECYRILKVGGFFEAKFPPAVTLDMKPNLSFYLDPTHCNHIIPGSFCCFCGDWRKEVNISDLYEIGYGIKTNFKMVLGGYENNEQAVVKLEKV